MKSNVFQLSHRIKNINRSKLYEKHAHWRKVFAAATFKGIFKGTFVGHFFSDKV